MRNYIPQQQQFNKFADLLEAASTQYTLSFRDACKALKCSRSWAQKYIRPNVANIYLPNGKGTGNHRPKGGKSKTFPHGFFGYCRTR